MQENNNDQNKKLISVYITEDLSSWISKEAANEGRSFSGMAAYFLEEARRVREHNRKAMKRNG